MEVKRKTTISASAARSHTREDGSKLQASAAGLWGKVVLVLGAIILAGLVYKAVTPPPPKVLNSLDGPQVTATRIQMRDGRFLAYKEVGVSREAAKRFVVTIHGYGASRHLVFPIPKEVAEELGLYIISFDRAGYGQSDPNPKRTIQSDAEDVVDLVDGISPAHKFYVITTSIGGYTGWGLLKYKPERVAGIALAAPVTNYWWKGLPASELTAAWNKQTFGDKMSLIVAHYFPTLLYWYMTQNWLPTSSVAPQTGIQAFSSDDQEIMKKSGSRLAKSNPEHVKEASQQGDMESKYRDMIVMFGDWPFTPMDLENTTTVHIWQGSNDYLVPVLLQRHVAQSLPWAEYHELPNHGHFLNGKPGFAELVVRTLIPDRNQQNAHETS